MFGPRCHQATSVPTLWAQAESTDVLEGRLLSYFSSNSRPGRVQIIYTIHFCFFRRLFLKAAHNATKFVILYTINEHILFINVIGVTEGQITRSGQTSDFCKKRNALRYASEQSHHLFIGAVVVGVLWSK